MIPITELLGCSEQTQDRRLREQHKRRGKSKFRLESYVIGAYLEGYAYEVELYPYDKRFGKDLWANSKWTTSTLKAVSETEDIYVFWKPGEYVVNRERLTPEEWKAWGYRLKGIVWRS